MIHVSDYPSPTTWQLDHVRLNLGRMSFHVGQNSDWGARNARLTALGFRRSPDRGSRFIFPSDYPLGGHMSIACSRGEGLIVRGTVNLSPFALAMKRYPMLARGNRLPLDGSDNFFSLDVVDEYDHAVLRAVVSQSLRSALGEFENRLAVDLGSTLGVPADELSYLLRYSLSSVEVCWDVPSSSPMSDAQCLRPALTALCRESKERCYSADPFYLESVSQRNGWGISGYCAAGIRLQVYVKASDFVRLESRYESWDTIRRVASSTRLTGDDPIGDLLRIAQSIADVEAGRWLRILEDSQPPSEQGLLAEFIAMSGSVIRDPGERLILLAEMLSTGSIKTTKRWQHPIRTLVKRGVLVRVAPGRYQLAHRWRWLLWHRPSSSTSDSLTADDGVPDPDPNRRSEDRHLAEVCSEFTLSQDAQKRSA